MKYYIFCRGFAGFRRKFYDNTFTRTLENAEAYPSKPLAQTAEDNIITYRGNDMVVVDEDEALIIEMLIQ